MISMYKIFKCQNGDSADVKFVDGPIGCPAGVIVGGKNLVPYNLNGLPFYDYRLDGPMRLIEVSPYADFKIDDPVMVRNAVEWVKRHFAGVTDMGAPKVWDAGFTSWTSEEQPNAFWNQCRRPTAEELAS